jgi:hypothetical protein
MHRIALVMALLAQAPGCAGILDLGDVTLATRNYRCGYATPGHNCDNGRSHTLIVAADMSSAITACRATRPSATLDFCYVIDGDGAVSTDASECAAAAASWRPNSDCCNFLGTASCP